MGITFKEAIAEVELGLVSEDRLPEIATSGLLEGYDSTALANLAGQFGEPYDPIEIERLWFEVMQELDLPAHGRRDAGRILVRAYARLVAEGELPPQLGASKIAGVHRVAGHPGCDARAVGDCLDAADVIQLFCTDDGRGYPNQPEHDRIDRAILSECRRLAELPVA